MTKKLTSLFALALLVLSFGAVEAQAEMQPVNIAVVDMQRIMTQSDAARSIRNQLEARRQSFASGVKAQEEKLRGAEEELRRQQAVLSQEEFQEKVRAFEDEAGETRRRIQLQNRALEEGFNKALSTLTGNAREIAASIADEEEVKIVLTRRQVLLADRELEITDRVLEELNSRLPNVQVEIPQITEEMLNQLREQEERLRAARGGAAQPAAEE